MEKPNGVVNVQTIFLNKLRISKNDVNVFLVNGAKLKGKIVGFDMYTIVLENNNKQTLIYKNSVGSITISEGCKKFTPISIENR